MPRRIEIELTSARPDGTWTWRAAGAREPKGVLDGGLLYEGAKAGDVLRAEAEFELEGIVITAVTPPKTDQRPQSQTIEIVGPGRPEGPGVTTQLVGRGDRRDRRRTGDDDRRRERGPGRPRTEGGRPRREGIAAGAERGGPERTGPERNGRPPRGEGGSRDAGSRGAGGRDGGRRERREGTGPRPPRPEGDRRPGSPGRTSSQSERGDRTKTRRLNPGSAHRKAVMESLPPEQQPIAEQLLRGGIPAVRTALHLEREKAEAEGRTAPNSEALLAIAESLLPRLRAAEWRDRAEAAVAGLDGISMRDLRSVVAGADVARDEESRKLATALQEALDARVTKLHTDWTADIIAQLDAGRVVRAVRLSGRPPDAAARLDSDLTGRLVEAAGTTLSPETPADLWLSLLEAVAESPIRRSVVPAGLPADAPPELKRAAHQYSGSIPALAKMLGVTIPPPPAPVSPRKRGDRPTGPRQGRPPQSAQPRPERATDRVTEAEAEAATAEEEAAPVAPTADAEAPVAPATGQEQAPAAEEHPASDAEQTATEASVAAAGESLAGPAEATPAEAPNSDGEAEHPSPS